MISTRFASITAALLVLALVPTVVHTYVRVTDSDGRTTAAIARQLHGIEGIDTDRNAGWVRDMFGIHDFVERRYGADVTLFVGRGYDAKRLYHHPELGLAYGRRYDTAEVVHLPAASASVPVHVLRGPGGLACYVLLYNNGFVEKPLEFQITQAFSMLFGPRRQMTLFFAHEPSASEPANSPAVRVLLAAVDNFYAQRPAAR
jgi:hypothetical protein